MAATDPTFGCGDFLPGYGPYSFGDPDFNWASFMDGGSGDDDDDDEGGGGGGPPDPTCKCYTVEPTEIYQDELSYTVTIRQECKDEDSEGASNEVRVDPADHAPDNPPPANVTYGDWSEGTVQGGPNQEECDCDENICPYYTITYTREKRQDSGGAGTIIIIGDSDVEPDDPTCSCKISGQLGPFTPTVDNLYYTHTVKFSQSCSDENGSPDPGAQGAYDTLLDSLSDPPADPGLGDQVGPPTVTGGGEGCSEGEQGAITCTGTCPDIVITWKTSRISSEAADDQVTFDVGPPLQAGEGLHESGPTGTGDVDLGGDGNGGADQWWEWTGFCPGDPAGDACAPQSTPGTFESEAECVAWATQICGGAPWGREFYSRKRGFRSIRKAGYKEEIFSSPYSKKLI